MSAVSGKNPPAVRDFDYWEFVHCAICYLPFITDPDNAPTAPPSVPFWLTDCAHTLCNNHLHADQSCAACGATAIQLVPLQRDMLPPMSDWFRSVPHGLDAIACAVKSQQDTMASLVRYYKLKCTQQRATIIKMKDCVAENKSLQSQVEQLQQELSQLRGIAGGTTNQSYDQMPYGANRHDAVNQALSYQPSETRNVNGKRPLADPHPNQRTSSPHSTMTPIGPSRLTLPPDHQQPVFPNGMNAGSHQGEESRDRPGSSRFDQYAYQPPATTFRAPPLRHQQQPQEYRRQQEQEDRQQQPQGHRQHTQQQQQQHHQHQPPSQQPQPQLQPPQQQRRMPPPQTPSRAQASINGRSLFRPAGQIAPQSARRTQVPIQAQLAAPPPSAVAPRQSHPPQGLRPRPFPMAVPTPTSSRLVSRGSLGGSSNTAPGDRRFAAPSTPSNRFFPPRSTAGIVVGTPRVGHSSSTDGGLTTRAPFVPRHG